MLDEYCLPSVQRFSLNSAAFDRGHACAGTAVVVSPVGSLTYDGSKTTFCGGEKAGPVCQELYDALTMLQTEQSPDPEGWVVPLSEMQSVIDAAPKA
jgi:branched-subunit amino acid aminotransferase/4-amino-4-deoxychorismate lyase